MILMGILSFMMSSILQDANASFVLVIVPASLLSFYSVVILVQDLSSC